MAKAIKTKIKLQIPGAKATPAPPIGPALGQHGLNISDFVSKFNAATQKMAGDIIPVEITVYVDKTYTFILKTPPAAELIKKAAGIEKGSAEPNKKKVGKITIKQVQEIAEKKMADLNANDIKGAMEIIKGTARNMGVTITEDKK